MLRNDVDLYGCRFRLVYFQPSSGRNPELEEKFKQNVLTVVRQVKYSTTTQNSIDLVLFLNGLPVFTSELKNELTGQDVSTPFDSTASTAAPKASLSSNSDDAWPTLPSIPIRFR